MFIKSLFLSLLLLLSVFSVNADDTAASQLKAFLQQSSSFSADFRQVSLDERGQAKQSSFGKFFLSRPGKFRWNYEKPYAQEIVANGSKVWFYDTDLAQVTIKKLDDSLGSTPALLLTGQVNLEEKFQIVDQGKDEDMSWIKLIPKDEESGFKYVLIGLQTGQLSGMELSDNFGQLTRIYFSNANINPSLKESLFTFVPPAGVDVFGN